MKNRSVILSLLTATLFAAPASAQGEPAASGPQGARPGREEFIKRFDKNSDGQLDETERQAARAEARKRGQERRDQFRKEAKKRFDKDGDGQLSDAEKAEARAAGKEFRHRLEHRALRRHLAFKPARRLGFHGPRDPAARAELLKRFDKDGDGKLGGSERDELHRAWERFLLAPPAQQPAAK